VKKVHKNNDYCIVLKKSKLKMKTDKKENRTFQKELSLFLILNCLISKNKSPNCLLKYFLCFLILITFLIFKNNFPYLLFFITFLIDFQ
jgi:hypothetical protein